MPLPGRNGPPPFRLDPVRFPRHSPRRSRSGTEPTPPSVPLPRLSAAEVSAGSPADRVRPRALARGCNNWRSWLRLLFPRRRLHWLWHRRGIRWRLGPRHVLGWTTRWVTTGLRIGLAP
jgi:hypothetical protein